MGAFSAYAAIYLTLAFTFQAGALLFVGIDGSCRANRFLWLTLICISGPVGLLIYMIWGREKYSRK